MIQAEPPVVLDEIVVTAARLPPAAGQAAFSVVRLGVEELTRVQRLDDALTATPAVSLFRRAGSAAANPTTQGISLRAIAPSGAGRALVTLDGVPLNDPFGGWVIWGQAPPETIARVNVLRGAGAGPYGAGALTGAVQLEERREQGAAFLVEGGEFGSWRAAGGGEAGGEGYSLMLAASAQASDGWVPARAGRGGADTAVWSDSAAAAARMAWRGEAFVFSARLAGYAEERGAGLVGAQSRSEGSSLALTLADPGGPFAWRLQAWALQSDLANTSVSTAPD